MKKKITIIGAGPSGLAVAYGLSVNGATDIQIIEKESESGGFSRTLTYNNYYFDIGPHKLSPLFPEVIDTLRAKLNIELLEKPNYHGVLYNSYVYTYPPNLKEICTAPTITEILLFGYSWIVTKLRRVITFDEPDADLKNSLTKIFGKRFCDKILFQMIEKVWGNHTMHPDFYNTRFSNLSLFGSVWKKILKKKSIHSNSIYYPVHGFGDICRAFEIYLKKNNVKFNFNTTIDSIRCSNPSSLAGPYTIAIRNNSIENTIHSDCIISTVSNRNLIDNLTRSTEMPELKKLSNSFVSRMLRLGIIIVTGFHLLYRNIIVPEKKYMFNRIAEMNHYADLNYPENETLLMLDVICEPASIIGSLKKADFEQALLADALKLKWFSEAQVKMCFSLDFNDAYPVMSIERYQAQKELEKKLINSDIYLCGREAASDYNNLHNAVAKGFLVADYLSGKIGEAEYNARSLKIGRFPILD